MEIFQIVWNFHRFMTDQKRPEGEVKVLPFWGNQRNPKNQQNKIIWICSGHRRLLCLMFLLPVMQGSSDNWQLVLRMYQRPVYVSGGEIVESDGGRGPCVIRRRDVCLNAILWVPGSTSDGQVPVQVSNKFTSSPPMRTWQIDRFYLLLFTFSPHPLLS